MRRFILLLFLLTSMSATSLANDNTPMNTAEQDSTATAGIADIRLRRELLKLVAEYRSYIDNRDIEGLQTMIPTGEKMPFREANVKFIEHLKKFFQMKGFRSEIDKVFIQRYPNRGAIFSINIHETFATDDYSDAGWVFFLLDCTDPEHRMIQIGTWQTDAEATRDGVYSVDDFYIP